MIELMVPECAMRESVRATL